MQMHQIEKNAGEGLTTIGKLIQRNKLENDDVWFVFVFIGFYFYNYSLIQITTTFLGIYKRQDKIQLVALDLFVNKRIHARIIRRSNIFDFKWQTCILFLKSTFLVSFCYILFIFIHKTRAYILFDWIKKVKKRHSKSICLFLN